MVFKEEDRLTGKETERLTDRETGSKVYIHGYTGGEGQTGKGR